MIDEPTVERRLFHRAAHLAEVLHVAARADVHVEAGDREVVLRGPLDAVGELLVPDAVLRVAAAGVGLLAVAVAEAGVDAERDRRPASPAAFAASPYWSIMSGEPQLTWMSCLTTQSSASRSKMSAVKTISGGCDLLARLEAGGDRAVNLAGAHAVDEHAVAAHQVEDRQVGAGLLGVANRVELAGAGRCGGRSGRRRRRRRACRTGGRARGSAAPAMAVSVVACGKWTALLVSGNWHGWNPGTLRVDPGSLYYAIWSDRRKSLFSRRRHVSIVVSPYTFEGDKLIVGHWYTGSGIWVMTEGLSETARFCVSWL